RFLFESGGFPHGIGLFLDSCHLLSHGLNLSGQLPVPRFHLGGFALDTFELAIQFACPLLLLRQQALKIQATSLLRLVLLCHHTAHQQERAEDDCRKRNLLADRHALTSPFLVSSGACSNRKTPGPCRLSSFSLPLTTGIATLYHVISWHCIRDGTSRARCLRIVAGALKVKAKEA